MSDRERQAKVRELLTRAVKKADAVIGLCDCIMSHGGTDPDPKRTWRKARDEALVALATLADQPDGREEREPLSLIVNDMKATVRKAINDGRYVSNRQVEEWARDLVLLTPNPPSPVPGTGEREPKHYPWCGIYFGKEHNCCASAAAEREERA